ncbi:UNVERIFIED_CONTAM: hypothetical protein Slati_2742700 [Sesamum latifolium]|uniref:Secreted protein n=1 Tax=Sesamum latifolium TaxID=2727402 RepID=A0AAW2VYK1_9LAMI
MSPHPCIFINCMARFLCPFLFPLLPPFLRRLSSFQQWTTPIWAPLHDEHTNLNGFRHRFLVGDGHLNAQLGRVMGELQ